MWNRRQSPAICSTGLPVPLFRPAENALPAACAGLDRLPRRVRHTGRAVRDAHAASDRPDAGAARRHVTAATIGATSSTSNSSPTKAPSPTPTSPSSATPTLPKKPSRPSSSSTKASRRRRERAVASVCHAHACVGMLRRAAGGVATVMLHCDEEGDKGSRQALYELTQRCRVQLAWPASMQGGRLTHRQPEGWRKTNGRRF